jgi:hypothetical protein
LQTSALPLGYAAESIKRRKDEDFQRFGLQSSVLTAISGYNTENQKLKTDSSFFRLIL